MSKNKRANTDSTIAQNRKARHDYHIEERFEAGVMLAGWEVKSLRAGKVQLVDSYVIFQRNEAWLIGVHITPLKEASTHVVAEPTRTRKLLLNRREINRLMGAVQQGGMSCVPLSLYWKSNRVKCEIALVRGKKEFDKRETEKDRDWGRQKQRIIRDHVRR